MKTSATLFRPRVLLILLTAIILLATALAAASPRVTTPLERLDLTIQDLAIRLRGNQPVHPDIVIVAIDDFSFNWTGYQWPWPRAYLAEIVDWLNQAGARVIGLDVFLFESDPDPQGDAALARALDEAQASVSVAQIYRVPSLSTVTLKLPLAAYRGSLDGFGITAIVLDEDAVARSIPAYDSYQGETYPNWAFEAARQYKGIDAPVSFSPFGLTFDGREVPLQAGRFLVDFRGPPGTYPTYSAARVLLGDYPAEAFRGKIVLIGATSVTLQDVYPTPFSAQVRTPGVEVIANAIDNLLTGNILRALPPWANLLGILLAALLSALIVRTQRPGRTLALLAALMAAYTIAYYLAFLKMRVFLPFIGPQAMLFLGVILPTVERAISEEIEKRRLHGLFARFLSPEMVDQLVATQDINSLNKRACLTILFSDIRGFTTLSEKITPEEVVALLNPYLEAMTAIVHKHGGTVDKYEGDAIVAFFGEPVPYADHALRAVRTAVEMMESLDELRQTWKAQERLPERFEIGIGLNTGEVFVGLLGSAQRVNYTVIGDAANLAARLQDQTKTLAWPILVNESTAEMVQEEFDLELAAETLVKGKAEPVRIFKVLGRKGDPFRIQPLML
jgi:adenylate cyclase